MIEYKLIVPDGTKEIIISAIVDKGMDAMYMPFHTVTEQEMKDRRIVVHRYDEDDI